MDWCNSCGYVFEGHTHLPDSKELDMAQKTGWAHGKLYPIIDASIKKQVEEFAKHKPILDPELYKQQMNVFYKAMEDNIIAQKYCGECLQSRPEDILELINDGWNIVQKPIITDWNNDTFQLIFFMEQWWVCKKCQENL